MEESFDFSEALKRMRAGKMVKRLSWGRDRCLLYDSEEDAIGNYQSTSENQEEGYCLNFRIDYASKIDSRDILAKDWVEV